MNAFIPMQICAVLSLSLRNKMLIMLLSTLVLDHLQVLLLLLHAFDSTL